jgi:hypothetical protein
LNEVSDREFFYCSTWDLRAKHLLCFIWTSELSLRLWSYCLDRLVYLRLVKSKRKQRFFWKAKMFRLWEKIHNWWIQRMIFGRGSSKVYLFELMIEMTGRFEKMYVLNWTLLFSGSKYSKCWMHCSVWIFLKFFISSSQWLHYQSWLSQLFLVIFCFVDRLVDRQLSSFMLVDLKLFFMVAF